MKVTQPTYLCPPVVKTLPGSHGEGDLNGPHLKCYNIESTDLPTKVVTLTDQFGRKTGVSIGYAIKLCVPAVKAIFPSVPTGTLPTVPNYKCYLINGATVNISGVKLDTQFGTENNVTVGQGLFLCAPAIVTSAGVSTGTLNVPHLVCYLIDPRTSPSVIVNLKTQFGLEQDVSVLLSELLCVPAIKTIKVKWGDLDCNGSLTIGDAQKIARGLLGLPVAQDPGCPMPGDQATVDDMPRTWGDLDCMNGLTIGDAQKTARELIGLPFGAMEGCPMPGEEVGSPRRSPTAHRGLRVKKSYLERAMGSVGGRIGVTTSQAFRQPPVGQTGSPRQLCPRTCLLALTPPNGCGLPAF